MQPGETRKDHADLSQAVTRAPMSLDQACAGTGRTGPPAPTAGRRAGPQCARVFPSSLQGALRQLEAGASVSGGWDLPLQPRGTRERMTWIRETLLTQIASYCGCSGSGCVHQVTSNCGSRFSRAQTMTSLKQEADFSTKSKKEDGTAVPRSQYLSLGCNCLPPKMPHILSISM